MRYAAPTTTKEAATLIAKAKGPAVVLAGGTDLLVRMKSGTIEPELIVDIKHISATQSITKAATGFRIGASVPTAAMSANAGSESSLQLGRTDRGPPWGSDCFPVYE